MKKINIKGNKFHNFKIFKNFNMIMIISSQSFFQNLHLFIKILKSYTKKRLNTKENLIKIIKFHTKPLVTTIKMEQKK
jgi:hypothetical protein